VQNFFGLTTELILPKEVLTFGELPRPIPHHI
jgi:hypothetical protein